MNDTIKAYISALRIRELQECLERLGMKKVGRKHELQQRLTAIFTDSSAMLGNGYQPRDQWRVDAAQRIIEDVYKKMAHEDPVRAITAYDNHRSNSPAQHFTHAGDAPYLARLLDSVLSDGRSPAAPAPPSAAAPAPPSAAAVMATIGAAASGATAPQQPAAASNTVIRCICGSNIDRGEMLQCQGSTCGIWQHADCAGIPAGEAGKRVKFYCETCRAAYADPFWEPVSVDIVLPARLRPTGKHAQVAERTFNLYASQYELFKRKSSEYRLQVVCLQLNDSVPFRYHWPLNADLKVNSMQYRVFNRAGGAKLGANQRDEPANIGVLCSPGKNKILLQCTDNASYVFMVQLVRRRDVAQVKALMKAALPLKEALQRVVSEFHADEDLQAGNVVLSLRCPLTGSRIKMPARFNEVQGLASFDLDAFLSVAERSRKWQCPHSMRNSSVHNLQVDSFMAAILDCLAGAPDINEVEISPQGLWRPAGSSEPWRSVDQPYQRPSGMPIKEEAGRPDIDTEESEDEEEELRQAAAAVAQVAKRPRALPEPEVIVIDDSDEEEPLPKRQQTLTSQQQQQQQQPRQHPAALSRAPSATEVAAAVALQQPQQPQQQQLAQRPMSAVQQHVQQHPTQQHQHQHQQPSPSLNSLSAAADSLLQLHRQSSSTRPPIPHPSMDSLRAPVDLANGLATASPLSNGHTHSPTSTSSAQGLKIRLKKSSLHVQPPHQNHNQQQQQQQQQIGLQTSHYPPASTQPLAPASNLPTTLVTSGIPAVPTGSPSSYSLGNQLSPSGQLTHLAASPGGLPPAAAMLSYSGSYGTAPAGLVLGSAAMGLPSPASNHLTRPGHDTMQEPWYPLSSPPGNQSTRLSRLSSSAETLLGSAIWLAQRQTFQDPLLTSSPAVAPFTGLVPGDPYSPAALPVLPVSPSVPGLPAVLPAQFPPAVSLPVPSSSPFLPPAVSVPLQSRPYHPKAGASSTNSHPSLLHQYPLTLPGPMQQSTHATQPTQPTQHTTQQPITTQQQPRQGQQLQPQQQERQLQRLHVEPEVIELDSD